MNDLPFRILDYNQNNYYDPGTDKIIGNKNETLTENSREVRDFLKELGVSKLEGHPIHESMSYLAAIRQAEEDAQSGNFRDMFLNFASAGSMAKKAKLPLDVPRILAAIPDMRKASAANSGWETAEQFSQSSFINPNSGDIGINFDEMTADQAIEMVSFPLLLTASIEEYLGVGHDFLREEQLLQYSAERALTQSLKEFVPWAQAGMLDEANKEYLRAKSLAELAGLPFEEIYGPWADMLLEEARSVFEIDKASHSHEKFSLGSIERESMRQLAKGDNNPSYCSDTNPPPSKATLSMEGWMAEAVELSTTGDVLATECALEQAKSQAEKTGTSLEKSFGDWAKNLRQTARENEFPIQKRVTHIRQVHAVPGLRKDELLKIGDYQFRIFTYLLENGIRHVFEEGRNLSYSPGDKNSKGVLKQELDFEKNFPADFWERPLNDTQRELLARYGAGYIYYLHSNDVTLHSTVTMSSVALYGEVDSTLQALQSGKPASLRQHQLSKRFFFQYRESTYVQRLEDFLSVHPNQEVAFICGAGHNFEGKFDPNVQWKTISFLLRP